MIYSDKLRRAVQFASHRHRNQKRMVLGYPYITHPLVVVQLVSKFTNNQDVLCAAALHDAVEDTETSLQEIRDVFGERIEYFVDILSHDNSLDYEERNKKYFQRIMSENNKAIFLIKSADILYNLTDFIETIEIGGKDAFLDMFSNFTKYQERIKNTVQDFEKAWPENPFLTELKFYVKKVQAISTGENIHQKISCGIFPIYINQRGEYEFLLVESLHGKIAQPKGHMNSGETFLETAKRELFEETGLVCSKIYSDYLISEKYLLPKKQLTEKIVYSFIGFVDSKKVTLQEEEIAAHFWLSAEEALEKITFSEQKQSFSEMLDILKRQESKKVFV